VLTLYNDVREQRQNMLVHTRGALWLDRFEGFDKQNDFRQVHPIDFSAMSIIATTILQMTKAYRLCQPPSRR
jgi:hypothetical protein